MYGSPPGVPEEQHSEQFLPLHLGEGGNPCHRCANCTTLEVITTQAQYQGIGRAKGLLVDELIALAEPFNRELDSAYLAKTQEKDSVRAELDLALNAAHRAARIAFEGIREVNAARTAGIQRRQ